MGDTVAYLERVKRTQVFLEWFLGADDLRDLFRYVGERSKGSVQYTLSSEERADGGDQTGALETRILGLHLKGHIMLPDDRPMFNFTNFALPRCPNTLIPGWQFDSLHHKGFDDLPETLLTEYDKFNGYVADWFSQRKNTLDT